MERRGSDRMMREKFERCMVSEAFLEGYIWVVFTLSFGTKDWVECGFCAFD